MRKKILVIALLGYSAIALWGCVTSPKGEAVLKTEGLLEPSGNFRFSDLPMPAGFKLLPQESYSFENSGMRVALLKYQGKASIDQVVNFYKEQMAMYNWNLLNIIEYGERLLNFERENESCIINLSPRGSSIVMSISLGPKSQGISKKAKEPIK